MDKNSFFINALKAGLYKNKAWVISALSLIHEDPKAWELKPYPYRIVQNQSGHFYCDPDKVTELVKLDDAPVGTPIFTFKDRLSLKAGDLTNLNEDIETTTGNFFFNICCLAGPFKDKIPYINSKTSVGYIESLVASRMVDDPITTTIKPSIPKPENKFKIDNPIYVSEYLDFIKSIGYLTNFTQICTWGATAKMLVSPPGIVEFKNKLLEEYKDRLHDPEIVALIDKKLVAFDAEFLKGDPSENFLLSKKSRATVRRKMFLMLGADSGLAEGVGVDLITNSLEQGWQVDKFAAMNNTLRAGSYNRGQETQLGGVAVKGLLRASTNIKAEVEDCGSMMGRTQIVNQTNVSKLIGFSIVTPEGPIPVITPDDAGKYLGQTVKVRSPMYCKLTHTDFCFTCLGKKLSQNPYGVSLAVSDYGNTFLSIFLSKAHSKALEVQKMDYKLQLT